MNDAAPRATYGSLIRDNLHFRRLWMGDVVSLFGDWFNTIALYALIKELTDSPLALGLVLVTKMVGYAVASPLAGVIADRYNRRRLMIGADLLRCVLVLGFLWMDSAALLPAIYALIALQVMVGAVFRPAQSASLPNVTQPHELLTANALMASTWSTLLALGAALGGLAVSVIGIKGVFLVDSLSYLVSAWCIWRAVIPQDTQAPTTPLFKAAWGESVSGWRYLLRRPEVGRMALVKSFWAAGGGALVYMLTLLGPELTPEDAALGMGILLAARGLGTGVGPIVARKLFLDQERWPRILGHLMVVGGLIYATVAWMPWSFWIVLPIGLAHALSGANWVLSSVLLQERAEDQLRGRVFATEWLLLTLTNTVTTLAASLLLEYSALGLREAVALFSFVVVVMGLAWGLWQRQIDRRA